MIQLLERYCNPATTSYFMKFYFVKSKLDPKLWSLCILFVKSFVEMQDSWNMGKFSMNHYEN